MPRGPIAITGSTGRLGGRIARRLAEQGVPQRLIVRDAKRAPQLSGTEVRVASYGDRKAIEEALEGVQTLLFVSASESPTRLAEHFTLIDAAAAARVPHVVYTSFCGAAPDATFTLGRDHWATEQHLAERGFSATLLRDNLYLDFLPMMVGKDDVIRGPAGKGRVAAVAQDDIADVAATVLLAPEAHRGRTYEMTGASALSLGDFAALLSRLLGRPIRYHDETIEEAYESRAIYGAPKWQLDAWVSTYTAIKAGEWARVTADVARIAGHAPLELEQVLAAARR